MKAFLTSVFFAVVLWANAGFAQSLTLKQNMKAIDKLVKTIKLSVMDPASNAANAANAAQIIPYFQAVLQQEPDAINDIPQEHRAEAVQSYQRMIQQEIDLATELQAAFQNNDNELAEVILRKMHDLKSDGHDRFDP